ncbi:hypothetical protein VTI74DRAFT_3151 [Chaetomium olivicolor]
MSWSAGDWPSSAGDTPQDDSSQSDRPTDVASLAIFRGSQAVGLTREHVERNLKLLSVPFETLPQMPAFAPFFLYTTAWQKGVVALALAQLSIGIGRVLTPAEADAVAYHQAKFCSRAAWAPPAVLATTFFFLRRGRQTWRFPFYTPKPASFNPSVFPSSTRPIFTGASAERVWRTLRFGAYFTICQFVVKGAIHGYAKTSSAVGMLRDERLKDVNATFRREAQQIRQHHQQHRQHGLPPQSPVSQTASPQEAPESQTVRTGAFGDRPEKQQQPQRSAQWTQQAPEPQAGTPQDDDSFLFDDASPVAPAQRQEPRRPVPASNTGEGSAWDRIRQRAKAEEGAQWNQGGQQSEQSQGQGQQKTEYTFSSTEQEKAYAREQAQKEFDAMLERERRGTGESGERR